MSNDTSGFYKLEDGELLHAINQISMPDGSILSEKDDAEMDGWIWFDSKEAAMDFFGIKSPNISCNRMDCPFRLLVEEEE